MDKLQRQFAGLKADSFYRGVRMRNDIERMNDNLLRYRLRGDPADAEAFHKRNTGFQTTAGTQQHQRGHAPGDRFLATRQRGL